MSSQPHLARKSSSKGLGPVSGMTWKTPERANSPSATSACIGVEIQILAEVVNGHDDAGDAFGQAQARAQKLDQALVGDAAAPDAGEAAGQVPALEELLNHLWMMAGRKP